MAHRISCGADKGGSPPLYSQGLAKINGLINCLLPISRAPADLAIFLYNSEIPCYLTKRKRFLYNICIQKKYLPKKISVSTKPIQTKVSSEDRTAHRYTHISEL